MAANINALIQQVQLKIMAAVVRPVKRSSRIEPNAA